MKILIVDDDPISLRVLTEYLQQMHYAYVAANDGKQAWELLEKAPNEFALVITDRVMPHLHGLQLLEKMQQHPVLKDTPMLMLTGEAEKEDIIAAVKAGVEDFLYKPIEKELLSAVLQRLLK